jgi:secretion/DNA translocation related TadE-like protein
MTPRGDAGVATVLALGLASAVATAGVGGLLLAGAVAARHRAETAADLAALDAASHVVDGPGAACRAASVTARAGGASLSGCRVDGDVVEVRVSVPFPGPLAGLGPATARARAGPADPYPAALAGRYAPFAVNVASQKSDPVTGRNLR